jgi:hypothetical protein
MSMKASLRSINLLPRENIIHFAVHLALILKLIRKKFIYFFTLYISKNVKI